LRRSRSESPEGDCALLFGLTAGVARAAYEVIYWDYWLNPGAGATSNWDIPGNRWFCSFLYRDRDAWGTVAFIDNKGYNWWYTEYSYGTYTGTCSAGRFIDFTKVCHCKNSDLYVTYWARCVGRRNGTW
jgi:hypothetical protein